MAQVCFAASCLCQGPLQLNLSGSRLQQSYGHQAMCRHVFGCPFLAIALWAGLGSCSETSSWVLHKLIILCVSTHLSHYCYLPTSPARRLSPFLVLHTLHATALNPAVSTFTEHLSQLQHVH